MALELGRENVVATLEQVNLADHISDEELSEIGEDVVNSVQRDEESRSEWMDANDEWMKLAAQVKEEKSYPWPNASNVKYPLLTTAAIQFHARAQQALLKGNRPVKARVIGDDPDGSKRSRAERVGKYMSYQLMHEMEDWQDDMDRMLFILPIVGICFKKSYFSPSKNRNSSELILPQDLVVNYYAKDFKFARKTHILYKDHNEVVSLQRRGVYLDVDLGQAVDPDGNSVQDETLGLSPVAPADDVPHTIFEVHGWWDLDGDGYKEPWIITVDEATGNVLRISSRFVPDSVERNEAGEIMSIEPLEYFTRYVFLPDFTSKIYGLGFGIILGPINSAVNTVTNQLIDAGTLSVLGGGFLGRGIRLSRGGSGRFRPGEWRSVSSTGDDLKKGIFPMPIKEPSSTLFNLLGTLIKSGEKIGSINEALLGENPGQNQPYSTTAAVLEQGLKVFVGIYKRVYRGLSKEFENLYRLNYIYIDEEHFTQVMDEEGTLTKEDFNGEDFDIEPTADADIASETQALIKAESLLQKAQQGMPINVEEALRQVLEAEGHENINELMQPKPPETPPEIQLKMKEFEHKEKFDWATLQFEVATKQNQAAKDKTAALLNMAKIADLSDKAEREALKTELDNSLAKEKLSLEHMDKVMSQVMQAKDRELKEQEIAAANKNQGNPGAAA